MAAERSEAASIRLQNPNWRYVFENIRTDFINGLGGRKGGSGEIPPADLPAEASAQAGPREFYSDIFKQTPAMYYVYILRYRGDQNLLGMNQKGFINILLIVIVVALVGTGIYVVSTRQTLPPVSTPTPTPTPIPSGEKIIKRVGEREGSFLVQKINPDSVEGLWFEAYPIEQPNDPGTPKILHIGDDIGYACEGVSIKLISIDFSGQTITFNKMVGKRPFDKPCPICLAGNTLIDTPLGQTSVKDLRAGMSVWTIDKTGHRVSTTITKTSKVLVSSTHQMIHLVLGDGRDLLISPGHPTIDGRSIGDLVIGDLYEGTSVVSAKRITYDEDATYDILPSGDTGFYWANGILIDSTLR